MTRRWFFGALSSLLLVASSSEALAAKEEEPQGVPVRVVVTDGEGQPVPTAAVRHPQEAERHRVNSVNGSWEDSSLFLPDGSELRFTPGMVLELEISAPGFMTQVVSYQVRKRKNLIPVSLQAIQLEEMEIEEPVTTFKHDKPRETNDEPAPPPVDSPAPPTP